MVPGYWDNHGWGFGVSVVTRRDDPTEPIGKYGWDGGMGTTWSSDPREEMVTILMTPAMWTSPDPPRCAATSGPRPTGPSTTEAP